MNTIFEIFKIIFFILSIIIGSFFLRGNYYFDNNSFETIGMILMPLYLLIVGVMIGYIIASFLIVKNDLEKGDSSENKIYIQGFVIGTIIGVGIAILYLVMG
ncbi:hypothetical protein [Candidatus Vampirococcus lugosii]|uniref:Uncharacterized protein n=1 Tax=Candidatus Vampirococcus lugosii TaxID=2789015 RepID=A0ABS5QJZ9_9BACT|nr:hypothetical protein [Candidatus Vampirococcus lugosii]MBS8121580.1 hypothetical protein [Candidatus Vampirococcus lugosii]